jgi:regulator of sigma E protease
MLPFLISVLAFVGVLSPLVFLHELGHYLAAKACGVHVERFSIGFGPKILSWKDKSGTEWIFSWILLGGYVQMLGDANVASSVSKEVSGIDGSRTMAGKTHLQRIAIAAAGPAVNYFIAFVMFVTLFVNVGKPYHKTTVGDAPETSYAYQSGIRKNDVIDKVQGQSVETFEGVLNILKGSSATQPLEISIMRDKEPVNLVINPLVGMSKTDVWFGKLQFSPEKTTQFYEKQSMGKAIGDTLSAMNPWSMLESMNLKSMGGPIAIAHQAGNVIQQGWVPVLFLMAGLSLGLGFFNLLPLPVLDGGMIFIEALEWVSGRSISAKVRQGISVAAFGALLLLLVVLSWGDLMKIPAIAALLS